jgi:hypothetical protein
MKIIKVGPFSQRDLPHVWSWIYFHGKAEDMNNGYQDELGLEWEAPDLVRSDTPIEEVADGRLIRLQHVNGTDLFGSIWSGDCEYRRDFETGECAFHARRRGLICLIDDDESLDYAIDSYDKKKRHL